MATRRWLSAAVALGIVAACLAILVTDGPRLPAGRADGTYYNPCCGLMTLRSGDLRSGADAVSYVIERDKTGAYVLPRALVSVVGNRLDIDGSAYPLKLRLDQERDPSGIEVMDRSNTRSYTFLRRNGSLPPRGGTAAHAR